MNRRIKLNPSQLPKALRGIDGYRGRTYHVEVCDSVTIPMDAGLWSGGTREHYVAIRTADGAIATSRMEQTAPWSRGRADTVVPLSRDLIIGCRSMFCGKDLGWTFYVSPLIASQLGQPAGLLTD